MRYLSGRDLLLIHALIIDATGGAHGVHDTGLLQSAVERPMMSVGGKDAYQTVFVKAATYFESIARNHVFLDGNKRTALAASARFLEMNGRQFAASNKDAEAFALEVAIGKHDIQSIAAWLKRHSRRKRASESDPES